MHEDDHEKTSIRSISEIIDDKTGKKMSPYLLVISGVAVGKMFRINEDEILIGRSANCDITLDDDGVSRKHAKIVSEDGNVFLSDLGSTNGTWVEGEKVEKKELRDGDRIRIGSAIILKYGYQDNEVEKFVSQLYESATQDSLTKIYNKRYFLDRLEHEFAWHRRHNQPMTLIFYDIDDFKKINDTFGHQAGDYILSKLAEVSASQCRAEDLLARYGGEEFVVTLRQTTCSQGAVMAERIRKSIEKTVFEYKIDEGIVIIPVTVSIGVASLTMNMQSSSQLIEEADRQLYKSKQAGKNRVSVKITGQKR